MIAYLDNSATTRPDDRVVDKMAQCMREGYFNPSSVYLPAVNAFREVRACREELLQAVHGAGCRLIFTSGGTEANNLAILGAGGRIRGLKIAAVSAVEHPSVRACFDELARQGVEVRVIGVNGKGELDFAALEKALEDGAGLVSVMQVNNETGAINDIPRIHAMTQGRALLHVDGVQGFLRTPFSMKDAELYTLSGHKIHGPKGIGALVCRENILIHPRNVGGGQENGLRSGTENTPGIAGLREAARLMKGYDMGELMQKKLHLIQAFGAQVENMRINGPDPAAAAPHIVNLGFPGVRGEVMLHALEACGVYASTGSACSSKKLKVSSVLTAMGVSPTEAEWALRFSLSPKTTFEEIDYAAEKLGACYAQLRRFQRR
ncbi:MAG: cysteine desulfurase family protein [Eubacteriales bacterium]|nr:cysteine desulfurase family protein [Eubacteriales bacterium]MDY2601595.1 cysteine desulfurase family protein [Eubacteriales bacterium]